MRGFILSLLLFGFTVPATAREWHAREGGFSVKAELVDVRDGAAVLKRDDTGQEISVPLAKLSLEDVRFVHAELDRLTKAINGGMPADGATTGGGFSPPRAPGSAPSSGAGVAPATGVVSNPAPVPAAALKEDLGNYPTMPQTDVQSPPLVRSEQFEWQVSVDANPYQFQLPPENTVKSTSPQKSYSLKPQFSEHPSHFVFFAEGSKDFFAYHLPTQKLVGKLHFESSLHNKLAYSEDGHYFAAEVRNNTTNKPEVQVWSFASERLVRTITPASDSFYLTAIRFAGPDRIVIAEPGDHVVRCYDIVSGRMVSEIRVGSFFQEDQLAISPGGAYIAVVTSIEKLVHIYDLRTGVEAGQVGGKAQLPTIASAQQVSFSPDGEELLLYSNSGAGKHLITWDMRTGEKGAELRFDENPSLKGQAGYSYRDRPIEWRPDRSGWLIGGFVLVERGASDLVWIDDSQKSSSDVGQPRRFVDNNRLLDFASDSDRRMTMTLASISNETIASNREMIASGATAFDNGLPPLTPIVDERIQEIVTDIQWKYQPDEAPAVAEATLHDGARIIANYAQVGRMVMARTANRALIGLREPDENRRQRGLSSSQEQYFDLVDLQTGKPLMRTTLPFATRLKAVDPSGVWGAFADNANNDRVDLFDLATGKPAVAFRPFQNSAGEIASMAFGSDKSTLWVLSVKGELTQWKLPECRVVARRIYGASTRLQASPSGHTLCVASPRKMELLDADSGAMLGTLASPTVENFDADGYLAFSEDGRKLAMACDVGTEAHCVLVWDLVANDIEKSIPFPYEPLGISWGDDDVVLVNASSKLPERKVAAHLVAVHLPSERIGWNYLLSHGGVGYRGSDGRQWYVSGDANQTDSTVRAVHLPQAEDAELINDLPPLAPLLSGGDRLAIRVDAEIPTINIEREDLAKHLQDLYVAKAIKAGYNADPNAQHVLTIEVREKLTPETLRLRILGRFSVESIQKTEVFATLRITNGDGKLIWTDEIREKTEADLARKGIPPGVGVSEFFRQQQWRNVLKWIADAKVPAAIFDASSITGAGVSVMTVNGVEVRKNLNIPVNNQPGDKAI